jgi:hypothetical protein
LKLIAETERLALKSEYEVKLDVAQRHFRNLEEERKRLKEAFVELKKEHAKEIEGWKLQVIRLKEAVYAGQSNEDQYREIEEENNQLRQELS